MSIASHISVPVIKEAVSLLEGLIDLVILLKQRNQNAARIEQQL